MWGKKDDGKASSDLVINSSTAPIRPLSSLNNFGFGSAQPELGPSGEEGHNIGVAEEFWAYRGNCRVWTSKETPKEIP
ncbi:hypothetical protein FS842_005122 [Serendipita sp. 407]|nr:hypothetical protein FRC18_005052 [Serendipita sp. 400]KAG9026220.1 hypothetical protein FS842_005122 [Serendipita sp. 407]